MLSTWTIYEHPSDYPDSYVLRETRIEAGTDPVLGPAYVFVTLDDARDGVQRLAPGAYCMTRDPGDDPVIVETWL